MAISGATAPKADFRLLGRMDTPQDRIVPAGIALAALLLSSSLLSSSLLLIVALLVVLISHSGLRGSIADRPGAWSPEGLKAVKA